MSLSFVFLPAVDFLGVMATGIVLWFGGQFMVAGGVTLGVLVAFLAYVSRFLQPIQELSQITSTLQSAMAGGEQVVRLLDTAPVVQDAPGAGELPPIAGRITFGDGTNESPAWSPNGRHLAFVSSRAGRNQIFTVDRDGRNVRQITKDGNNTTPNWSQ